MKLLLTTIAIALFASCASFNHGDDHGAMRSGCKAHRESQRRLVDSFGNNGHAPNKFKKRHF
mgnify:CR=1 FL=1